MSKVYGSQALLSHIKDARRKGYKTDLDILHDGPSKIERCTDGRYTRLEYTDINSNLGLKHIYEHTLSKVLSLNDLYIIKLSHSFWNVRWEKTVHDLRIMQKRLGRYTPANSDRYLMLGSEIQAYNLLYDGWEKIHGSKDHIKLNLEPDKFFNKNVKRKYVHDDIHKAIAYNEKPMYNKLLSDESKVMPEKKMFFLMEYEEKIQLAREEIKVIALERFIIPANFNYNSKLAYRKALKLVVTSMTKGWFPFFIMNNIDVLYDLDRSHDFVTLCKEAIHNNELRLEGEHE